VDEPVKDRLGEGWLPNRLMPVRDRQLAGDDRGPAILAIVEQFQDISTIVIPERGQAPVVEHEDSSLGQGGHELHIAAIVFGERKLLEEPGETEGEHRPAVTAGLRSQRAREPGFADACGPGEQHVMPIASPRTRGQAAPQRLIQPAWVALVDSLNTGGLPELRLVSTGRQPSIFSGGPLPIHQESQAFCERHVRHLGHRHLLEQGILPPHQLQSVKCVACRVRQQGMLLVMERKTRVLG